MADDDDDDYDDDLYICVHYFVVFVKHILQNKNFAILTLSH